MSKGETRPRSRYAAFRAAVPAAEAEAELRCVGVIRRAADTDWKAVAWWLARKNPERWGYERRHRVAVQSGTGVIVVPGAQDIDAWQQAAVEQQRQLHERVRELDGEHTH